jgi:hypothetical protein
VTEAEGGRNELYSKETDQGQVSEGVAECEVKARRAEELSLDGREERVRT